MGCSWCSYNVLGKVTPAKIQRQPHANLSYKSCDNVSPKFPLETDLLAANILENKILPGFAPCTWSVLRREANRAAVPFWHIKAYQPDRGNDRITSHKRGSVSNLGNDRTSRRNCTQTRSVGSQSADWHACSFNSGETPLLPCHAYSEMGSRTFDLNFFCLARNG